MQISETVAPIAGQEPCRFPKLEECAHFHYEKVQLGPLSVCLQTAMEQSLHSQHATSDESQDWYTLQVSSSDECWLIQRSFENFTMLDEQLHQCIYDRKVSQLHELRMDMSEQDNLEGLLSSYLDRLCSIVDNSLNCGPILNWFQLDNRGHRLLVPSEESRSINTPAVAAAYSIRKYVSQARDELSLEVGDMISVIDMASPGESMWWRGKRGFQVGFFPQHCVHIIGDKVPRNMPLPPPVVGSLAISPIKPVLRKHGKLITFFRSFILNRPSRRRLKQSGILKERVFGCDLGEHLLNSGHEIPMVLKCCAEFIEKNGIVDGIYRLSGVTSNIQKLRNAFDEDRIPNLYTDDILQDIHSVASLLKMYFRELPNPLCTYQLYQSFVAAVQGCSSARNKGTDNERLLKMREAVQKLPPPHYRTLEYLMRHLARVAKHGPSTGMTTRNVAIVWAPNLLRCEELEVGGVAALQGVGVQAVVTEFLICYADLIFSDHLPNLNDTCVEIHAPVSPKRSRPKSLAISTPTKLLTLEEARNKHLLNKDEGNYIEVGGGPKNLPKKYHTIIELPAGSRKRSLTKRSPSGWRSFFSKSRNNSHGNLSKHIEISPPGAIINEKSVTESDLTEIKRKLRPVKSAESLTSGQSEPTPCENDVLGPLYSLNKPQGHNRSVSHDSYFDNLQTSTNNSVGSLLDLSEIQLNFELEESEMRIFSEDESLVSSPKVHRETTRKVLSRARPEDFSSAANSSNPSPKKQARVLLSPDSLSRKRSRIEDQLSDIQYIDCNTPDNPCLISTTAVIHTEDNLNPLEQYQPKNKSPRNSHALNRHSLNFEKEKIVLPKSLTEMDIEKMNTVSSGFNLNLTPTPGTPNYKPLDNTSSDSTPVMSDLSPDCEIRYENMSRNSEQFLIFDEERPKSFISDSRVYENVKSKSPTYENVRTTISITYRSPVKQRNDSIYEDIELNPEQALVPTTVAELPNQEASQSRVESESKERPNELDLTSETTEDLLKSCDEDSNGFKSATYKSISLTSTPISPIDQNSKKSLISPTEISMTEQVTESTSNSSSISPQTSPRKSSKTNSSPDNLLSSANFSIDNSGSPGSPILKQSPVRESPGRSPVLESPGRSPLPESPGRSPALGSPKVESPVLVHQSPVRSPNFSTKPSLRSPVLEQMNISPDNSVFEKTPFETSVSSGKYLSQDSSKSSKFERSPKSSSPIGSQSSLLNNIAQIDSPNSSNSLDAISRSPESPDDSKSPSEGLKNNNDKRKSCDDEILDQNSIYQQVKYFRRSVHEINSLLEQEQQNERLNVELEPKEEEEKREAQIYEPNHFLKFDSELKEQKGKKQDDQNFEPNFEQEAHIFNTKFEKEARIFDPKSVEKRKNHGEGHSFFELPKPENEVLNFGREPQKIEYETLNFGQEPQIFEPQITEQESVNFQETRKFKSKFEQELNFEQKSRIFEQEVQNLSSKNFINFDKLEPKEQKEKKRQSHMFEANFDTFEHKAQIFEPNFESKTLKTNFETEQTKFDDPESEMDSIENFDSLEAEKVHIYENVPKNKELDVMKTRMHQNEPKKIEIPPEEVQIMPVCSKCVPEESSVKKLTNKFEKSTKEDEKKCKVYDKDGLPPCLRAKNAKNSVKTKSLDENAFITEFGRANPTLQRRKSLDDRTSSYINSKMLIEPKNSPESRSTIDVSQIETKVECPITEQKLNRERIEKYKEERRNFLREKYRSESFREDNKEKILSRLKQKSKKDLEKNDLHHLTRDFNRAKIENTDLKSRLENKHVDSDFEKLNRLEPSKIEPKCSDVDTEGAKFVDYPKKSPLLERRVRSSLKELSDKILDETEVSKEEEFLRHRRGDSESEKKRHTYDVLREREYDSESHRRSLETRTPRKERVSPSYCIKDMKALFESKSSQN